ncbi:MAG: geranylgeranylglycerol-phosphate geranylgeranyltransferase [Chloroflexi bacterium]|nr:geranylgeranylglycerol-phosphate geranylgeranyltransferase [Chloroflexota bacterium]MCI0579307.1 geranylgeranylglycerol-phosphate geranylgeranyltransferase [Chloroflexota bacterium]MCI0644374.1 geranylgeranylglycerol-phosphate geranylgeranyltransferase [Chloroflexota bacterium]
MRRFLAVYKLARPFNALSGALAVLLGGYVAGTGEWLNIGLAAFVTLLVTAAGNAWNDYLDVEIDRINQPQRVLPAGMLSPRSAVLFAVGMSLLALVVAAFINLVAFLVASVALVALYLYSWRLKSTVLMGNATVAAVSALSAVFGGVAAGNVWPTFWLAMIIATAIMGREVLKTLADYEGDLRQRCRTIATAWGRRPARIVFYLLAAATVWVMLLPYLLDVYTPVYAYIVAVGVYPVVIYILIRVSRYSTGRQLERLSQLMKLDFLIWFLAVLFGAAG